MPQDVSQTTSAGAESDHPNHKDPDPVSGDGLQRRRSVFGRSFQKLSQWRKREDEGRSDHNWTSGFVEDRDAEEICASQSKDTPIRRRNLLKDRLPRRWRGKSLAAPGHRRFKSEERVKTPPLVPHINTRRRAVSEDRRAVVQNSRGSSPPRTNGCSSLAANGLRTKHHLPCDTADFDENEEDTENTYAHDDMSDRPSSRQSSNSEPEDIPRMDYNKVRSDDVSEVETIDRDQLIEELENKWILNLSMQFRDESKREKLFITYAEKPNFWRRLTVVWDYKNVRPGSLEDDLKSLTLQRDKNVRVYESLRVSLEDIKFYDTVTMLKLVTEDDNRLHIYVNEDPDEIIDYPSTTLTAHMDCPKYKESEVTIDGHLSGFVYRVKVHNQILVKKEVPGPMNVEEFLYEMNAVDSLQDARFVIDFHGIVTDEKGREIRALLISYAAEGTLADMIYDFRHTESFPWERRRKWAGQILAGMSAIHESGYVQGDFTLSNVVIDEHDNANIIDLNRRGCPVGWEPPELMRLILSKQKIAMMIGVKSDLYQMGMVLWALAEQVEEPDRLDRDDLSKYSTDEIPGWYRDIVESCLQQRPQDRRSADVLLRSFKKHSREDPETAESPISSDGSEEADPDSVVSREDIESDMRGRHPRRLGLSSRDELSTAASQIDRHHEDALSHRREGSVAASLMSGNAAYLSISQKDFAGAGRAASARRSLASKASNVASSIHGGRSSSKVSDMPGHPTSIPHRLATGIRHTDSGFQDTDSPMSLAHQHSFPPPMHKDSGFDESLLSGVDDSERYLRGGYRLERREEGRSASDDDRTKASSSSAHDSHMSESAAKAAARLHEQKH